MEFARVGSDKAGGLGVFSVIFFLGRTRETIAIDFFQAVGLNFRTDGRYISS